MQKNYRYILFSILIIATLMRLFNLSTGDVLGDEGLYAFRAIGPLDFDEAEFHTTPLEWLDGDIPVWTSFSFHDHPPLVFWTQHLFLNIFGENVFSFRLPSVILGVLSVYLVYLLGTFLFSRMAGLAGAALLAVTANHVFISRVGLQESYVIFFVLLSSYFFLRALRRDRAFIYFGIAVGLGMLTKYTFVFMFPVFALYLLVYHRLRLTNRRLWQGTLIAFVIFLPVIIYNVFLYAAVGHFDFQLSYVLGQQPEVWQTAPGKEMIGSFARRVMDFFPTLFSSQSWLFFTLSLIAVVWFAGGWIMRKKGISKKAMFLVITIAFLLVLYGLIGPTVRFLTMLTPFLALIVGLAFVRLNERGWMSGRIIAAGVVVVMVFEVFYSFNSQILNRSFGAPPWMFSFSLRQENYHWGYSALDDYFERELRGRMPGLAFSMKYEFLNDLQTESLAVSQRADLIPYYALIVYDGNVLNIPQLWVLDRRHIYHGWPVISVAQYYTLLEENGDGYFEESGFEDYYFVTPTENVQIRSQETFSQLTNQFESYLMNAGEEPDVIYNKRNEPAFKVYHF
jgi:4-amino-4-deoxy-L-arabinose transferase-like glycosyltransferase